MAAPKFQNQPPKPTIKKPETPDRPYLVRAPEWGPAMWRTSETRRPVSEVDPWCIPLIEQENAGRQAARPPAEPPPAPVADTAAQYSRWTGEPLGEAAGQTQKGGIGQSH
jgi:hypothetical protein